MSIDNPIDPFQWLRPASQLTACPIEWLWPGFLALGQLAILDGDPGLGKSILALDLSAPLSTGRPFPDGQPGPGVFSAIVLNGEDSVRHTILPRLKAMGADMDRVLVIDQATDPTWKPVRFPSDVEYLDQVLARTGAKLVVIDPITVFLDPGVNVNSDQSVRRALLALARLAAKYGCVILLVRHLNKTVSLRSIYRGGGSVGIVGACRSGWLVARDPEHADRGVLAQVKNNLAPRQPSLGYQVEAPPGAPAKVTWLGPCSWTADQLLAAAANKPVAVLAVDRAGAFLAGVLAQGPRTSRDIWSLAQEQNMTRRTLRRAKRVLGVRSQRVWADGKRLSYWLLPEQKLPPEVTPESDAELDEYLAQLNAKYPPATPIDEL